MGELDREDLVVHAPELPQDFVWLNTPRPLSLRELRGQLVILDFWTYCCVNCMHVLPVLDALERRHAGEPIHVIGVHSAKFEGERDPERIADAIERYGVHHPVVVDRDMKIWHDFAVRSWPTLVVVRPDGTLGAVAPGEPDPAVLESFVVAELERAKKRGTLAAKPFELGAVAPRAQHTLSFPGKLALAANGRIAVSDSGHHRVLLLSRDGEVLATIGSGVPGHRDGAFDEARLDDPQGLVFDPSGRVLYVADAKAHAVLRVDLDAQAVTTIAGDGRLGEAPIVGTSDARTTRLRSPWDLAYAKKRREGESGDLLYVALAGSHQIGVIDLEAGTLTCVSGNGAESMNDGPLAEATFSQPSGLALAESHHELWLADSETSSLRMIDFHHGTVRTVVGAGLFDFGDLDGPHNLARLQHCLGVTFVEGSVIVADTYNHKLKRIDARTGEVQTLFVGADGHILREPGDVKWDAARRVFLVADTGHHRLVEVSSDGGKCRILAISGAPPVSARGDRDLAPPSTPVKLTDWFTAVVAESTPLASGPGTVRLRIVPAGALHLALESPLSLSIEVSRRSDLLVPKRLSIKGEITDADAAELVIEVNVEPFDEASIASEMLLALDCVTCNDGGTGAPAACTPLRTLVRLPIRLAQTGAHEVRFEIAVGDAG